MLIFQPESCNASDVHLLPWVCSPYMTVHDDGKSEYLSTPCAQFLPFTTLDEVSALLHPLLLLCPLCLKSPWSAATNPWDSGFSLGSANADLGGGGGQQRVSPSSLFLLLPSYQISANELCPSSQHTSFPVSVSVGHSVVSDSV